jgi:hypothetical protein
MATRVRRAGILRRRGLDDAQLNQHYERESGHLDEEAMRDLYGSAREVERFRAQEPSAPGYQSRGRQLLTDGQGRTYNPLGSHEPTGACVYVDMAETRRRNKDDMLPIEFPREGDTLKLWPIRRSNRNERGLNYDPSGPSYQLRVANVERDQNRTASAVIWFYGRMPQRDEVETELEERRRDAVLDRQMERARATRDRQ